MAEEAKDSSSTVDYERLYRDEARQRRTLTGVSLVLGIVTVGALAVTAAAHSARPTLSRGSVASRFVRPPMSRGGMPRGGRTMGQPGASFNQFLKSDGSVDSGAVKSFIDSRTTGDKTQLIDRLNLVVDRAEAAGKITADQAKALHEAIGSSMTASAQS